MLHAATTDSKSQMTALPKAVNAPSMRTLQPPLTGKIAASSAANLQQTYGNQAVLRMLNATMAGQAHVIQRKCACGGTPSLTGECAACRTKRMQSQGIIQPKLAIGPVNDQYEQEADRVADQVMRMPDSKVQRQVDPTEEGQQPIHLSKLTHPSTPLQRSSTTQAQPPEAPPIVHEVLHSSGQPLDTKTRAFMEPRFGQDFGQVRVHIDERANESAQSINSLAYTLGNNIVFGTDEYQPSTFQGQRLLAHELTHVIQQNTATSRAFVQRLPDPNCGSASGLPFSDSCANYNNTCYSSSFTASSGTSVRVNVTVNYYDAQDCSFPEGQEDFRVQLYQCGWIDTQVKDFGTTNLGGTLTGTATLPGSGWIVGNDNYFVKVYSRSGCKLTASINVA